MKKELKKGKKVRSLKELMSMTKIISRQELKEGKEKLSLLSQKTVRDLKLFTILIKIKAGCFYREK